MSGHTNVTSAVPSVCNFAKRLFVSTISPSCPQVWDAFIFITSWIKCKVWYMKKFIVRNNHCYQQPCLCWIVSQPMATMMMTSKRIPEGSATSRTPELLMILILPYLLLFRLSTCLLLVEEPVIYYFADFSLKGVQEVPSKSAKLTLSPSYKS